MRQSEYHSLDVEQSIVPTCIEEGQSADVTTGTTIDLQGCESATLELNIGALTTSGTTFDAEWQESDASGSGFTAIDVADLIGGALITQRTVAGGDSGSEIIKDGYLGDQRYIRCVITATTAGSTGRANFSANVIKGHLRNSV